MDYVKLVEGAQLGDKEDLERLTELAELRLREDVGRITLNPDLTQDIVQETLLEMMKKLNELKTAERFWKWLTQIAFNKINHHHRQEKRYKTALASGRDADGSQRAQAVVAELIGHEFQQIVRSAMQRLKPRQRTVLALRCYRDMAYADIAEVMGCSEFAAMMLFHRAKKSLGKQLARHGYGKGLLLPALVLFGKLTASSEATAAQVSVCAAVTEGGLLLGLATSKTALVTLSTAGVLAVGTAVSTLTPETPDAGSVQESVPSALTTGPGIQTSTRTGEYWHYFPKGPSGPMMLRVTSAPNGPQSNFQYLQNAQYNYAYRDHTIHINNQRMHAYDLSVLQLPTDSPQMAGFISQVQGHGEAMEYVPNRKTNLLIVTTYDSQKNTHRAQVERHSNVLDERYFLPDWPADAKVVDNRDVMHKRGWTYFRVTGRIGAQGISGTGRIPFVYATCKRYRPWLKLKMADGTRIVDRGGSFFKGLARPWMGLHTIDTVRRDAAEQEVWFETKALPDSDQVEVTLDCGQVKLVYTIDMETDVIDKITFVGANGILGEMRFSYLQEIVDVGSEFDPPGRISGGVRPQPDQGMLWLVNLVKAQ